MSGHQTAAKLFLCTRVPGQGAIRDCGNTHAHTHTRRAAGRHGPGPNVQHTLLPLAETCAPCRLLQALASQHMEAHPGLGQTVAAETRRVPVARWVSSGGPKRHDPTDDSATAQVAAAAGEDRTHDLRIMRPTRYQLRHCRGYQSFASCLASERASLGCAANHCQVPRRPAKVACGARGEVRLSVAWSRGRQRLWL